MRITVNDYIEPPTLNRPYFNFIVSPKYKSYVVISNPNFSVYEIIPAIYTTNSKLINIKIILLPSSM